MGYVVQWDIYLVYWLVDINWYFSQGCSLDTPNTFGRYIGPKKVNLSHFSPLVDIYHGLEQSCNMFRKSVVDHVWGIGCYVMLWLLQHATIRTLEAGGFGQILNKFFHANMFERLMFEGFVFIVLGLQWDNTRLLWICQCHNLGSSLPMR